MNNTITDFKPQAIVIDAGTFPVNPIALSRMQGIDKIVCCDGAANSYLSQPGRTVWRIVGDCDSMSAAIREKYSSIIRRFPDQETNDQTKAVSYLAAKGIQRIAILGATGLREDHTLGNITLLPTYLADYGIDARIYTDYGVFIPARNTRTFESPAGTRVSIFNFGATGLEATGLRYPLRDFDSLWQGTLNTTTADRFTISAQGLYMVFINY